MGTSMNNRESAPDALAEVFEELAANRVASVARLDRLALEDLSALGVVVSERAVLADDVELLSAAAVLSALEPATRDWLRELTVLAHVGSTNTMLLGRADTDGVAGRVLTAEVQTAGRGRRGRQWLSPFGRNLAVSIGFAVDRPPAELGALSLVVGVAVRDALVEYGLEGIELKWPNDVLMHGRKLAGVLIELAQASRPAQVVVGIGANVGCRAMIAGRVDQIVADVAEQVERPSRNRLLAGIVNHVVAASARFGAGGFAPFRRAWEAADRYRGASVTLTLPAAKGPQDTVTGVASGVGPDGALRIETPRGVREFIAGEVSLKARDDVPSSDG